MSGEAGEIWSWLPSGTDEDIAAKKTSYFDHPSKLWSLIQESVTRSFQQKCEQEAKVEIHKWLQLGKWDDVADDTLLPGDWNGKKEKFQKKTAFFKKTVFTPLPEVLDQHHQARLHDERKEAKAGETGSAHVIHSEYWRFFSDPKTTGRRQWHFSIVAVFERKTKNAHGKVIPFTIELLRPGNGDVILHPLIQLMSVDGEWEEFRQCAQNAFRAAKRVTKVDDPVTGVISIPDAETAPKWVLNGDSADGAMVRGFGCALRGEPCEQRVLVITSIDPEGVLTKVGNDDDARTDAPGTKSTTDLNLKAEGIATYNANLQNQSLRIDTVVVMESQREVMETALKAAKCDPEEIRVYPIPS